MPVYDSGVKWNVEGTSFMLNPISEKAWRLTGYLDIAPGHDNFFDN